MSTCAIRRVSDGRTVETGKHNIKDFTERENIWANGICLDYNERGRKCKIIPGSVGRDGEFIEGQVSNDPDFLVVPLFTKELMEELMEVKTNPEGNSYYQGFKSAQMQDYYDNGAYVIVPMINSLWDKDNGKWRSGYFKYPNKILPWILSHRDNDPTRGAKSKFGKYNKYKLVSIGDIEEKIQLGEVEFYEWMPRAKAYINRWAWKLTAPKKIDNI